MNISPVQYEILFENRLTRTRKINDQHDRYHNFRAECIVGVCFVILESLRPFEHDKERIGPCRDEQRSVKKGCVSSVFYARDGRKIEWTNPMSLLITAEMTAADGTDISRKVRRNK